jgi:hypothetical protein
MAVSAGMLFYNSTLSLPMLAMALISMGEPMQWASYPRLLSRDFQVCRGCFREAWVLALNIELPRHAFTIFRSKLS